MLAAAAVLLVLLWRPLNGERHMPEESPVISPEIDVELTEALLDLPRSSSDTREADGAGGALQKSPSVSDAGPEMLIGTEDRSDWTIYQWREVHAQSWLSRYQESEDLADRVNALKCVGAIAVATILDGRGRGLVGSGVVPKNQGDSWGFSLNGVTYEFHANEFPEYQRIQDLDARLFTPAEPGESREISEELERGILNRLAEAQTVAENLGRGPSYHQR